MMMAVMPSASAQTGIILPDVNVDGNANVGDVTGLIDYLLNSNGSATWSNQRLSAYDFGAVGDGVTDDTNALEALFANQNYQIAGDAELYFHNAVNVIFQMLGFYVETERHTSDGSMDMLVQTKDYIYIFEFKLDQSVAKALEQIEEKQYAAPFAQDMRKLYKIGVNFSSTTRKVEAWQVVER